MTIYYNLAQRDPFLYTAIRQWRVLWFHVGRPCVRPTVCRTSVRPYFRFRTTTSGFSPCLLCALICGDLAWDS